MRMFSKNKRTYTIYADGDARFYIDDFVVEQKHWRIKNSFDDKIIAYEFSSNKPHYILHKKLTKLYGHEVNIVSISKCNTFFATKKEA